MGHVRQPLSSLKTHETSNQLCTEIIYNCCRLYHLSQQDMKNQQPCQVNYTNSVVVMSHIYLFRFALEVALGSSEFLAARGVFGWLEPWPRPRPAAGHINKMIKLKNSTSIEHPILDRNVTANPATLMKLH